jgi:hypothetical protein
MRYLQSNYFDRLDWKLSEHERVEDKTAQLQGFFAAGVPGIWPHP